MKLNYKKNWAALLGVTLLTTAAAAQLSHAELVYDDEVPTNAAGARLAPAQTPHAAAAEERDNLRSVIRTSQKAQVTAQSAPQAVEPSYESSVITVPSSQVIATPPVVVEGNQPEVQNLSKSELLRRERLREEMKNEDILQERLEELRLRAEQGRTEQILGRGEAAQAPAASPALVPSAPMQMQNEVVVVPATERPGQPQIQNQMVTDQIGMGQASVSQAALSSDVAEEEKTKVMIAPKFGLSSMNGITNYNVNSRFSTGIGIGIGVTENTVFEVGYNYSEYGVALNNTYAPTVGYAYIPNYNAGMNNFETIVMKQNVFDLGMKFYVLNSESKVRPFVGGGGAYSKGFINYDQQLVQYYGNQGSPDYELSQFLGYLSTGFDVRISKAVSIGAGFKYYTVLSSRQNQNLNNAAFLNPYGYGAAYNPAMIYNQGQDKQGVGGSLANSSFHTIQVGASFSF